MINPVLWSLEIEVQFYLLCPLLGLGYFRYQNLGLRRLILAGIILIWALLSVSIPGLSFLNHGYYFLGGMLLCDLHHNTGLSRLCHSSLAAGLGFLLFGTIFTINYSNPGSALLRAALVSQLVVFCFLILNQPLLRRLITIMPLPLIGGMCYSIYMLHYGIMKLLAPRLFSMGSQLDFGVFFLIQLCLLCLVVLLCSAIFFKLLERPCMRKDWAQSLWLKLKWTHNSQGKKHEDG